MTIEGRWIHALREHGQAYEQCKTDFEALKRSYHDQLARVNPEKQFTVAALQAKIQCIEDLLLFITNQERKDLEHVRREAQRNAPVRAIKSA